ncbi:MAG TPA: M23 family metallopeptidase [Spirochaetota bacterium]|nr:M23 family metallopeptidase [Spirochaetota bacterium]HPJ35228.1 M23 family metallopeptidase [Spirochaetota bacterium]
MTMPTMYQLDIYKRYLIGVLFFVLLVFLTGNIITYFFNKKVYVNPDSYTIKDGFPLFVSEKEYIDLINRYPYNPGVQLREYKVTGQETLWSIKKQTGITIDTLISANPHLRDLEIKPGQTIIIPSKNGTLLTFDDYSDISRMHKLVGTECRILGDYRPGFFTIVSPDDIKIVFFEDARPRIVNSEIEKIYKYKMAFIDPIDTGFYTSMFGNRLDPIFGKTYEFHNGIDIATHPGTPIKAVRDGLVFFTGWRDGYGKTVIIQHYDGYTTFYAHCRKIITRQGQWVKQGEVIATVGSTGRSTGNHLHYTVFRHGIAINPIKYLW